ncbi:ASCH domain-containing protein [Cupriavidus pauculus]|uniref:ASCH domain-containing protein n=1 Tax=Cupriavidus pauculus TaxID=82633 RepID=A0A3G8H050_9BURK|nr:ASCH domain-containing protein [Cupriavidus pauculus]AZG13828.1 ASCH domain-containing protein [Cupriavidus pauculus]
MTLTRSLPTKALSIRQPWAWLIVNGHKDIENRTWATRFRGPVLIHAAKGMTRLEYSAAALVFQQAGIQHRFPLAEELQRGGIVGMAEVTACVPPERRTSYWHMAGCQGFALRGAQPLPFTPLAGRLGFFAVPADVLSQIIQNQ